MGFIRKNLKLIYEDNLYLYFYKEGVTRSHIYLYKVNKKSRIHHLISKKAFVVMLENEMKNKK